MGSEDHNLHVFIIPCRLKGHMIPTVDLAKLLAKHGVEVSLIATTDDAAFLETGMDQTPDCPIKTHILESPSNDAELPNRSFEKHDPPHDLTDFLTSLEMFQEPLARLVEKHRPDCIVSDFFLPWTAEVTAKFGIPRLSFNASSFFALCVYNSLRCYSPQDNVASDSETFALPGLPHQIELTKSQLTDKGKTHNSFLERVMEADGQSFGIVMNSFYDLEGDYIKHFKSKTGKRAWAVGPLSLCHRRTTIDVAARGKSFSISVGECLEWLDAKAPESVLYVCFGSMCRVSAGQLTEIALALESSDCRFLWVVGESSNSQLPDTDWPLGELEKRLHGRGLIIRGWAPQVVILNHPAVGAFVTHCGWNSILEAVSAGVAMITWPMFAEQFYNEKLITQVLKVGRPVGCDVWVSFDDRNKPLIVREKIEKAIVALMNGGDESERIRTRAKEMGQLARAAVEPDGSSHADVSLLINDLKMYGQEAPGTS